MGRAPEGYQACRDCGQLLAMRGKWASANERRHAKACRRRRRLEREAQERAFREGVMVGAMAKGLAALAD